MTNYLNRYCFSKPLKLQLAKIPGHFLTVVEAPSGFGKTTAVREYFAQTLKGAVCEKWYTCLGESPAKAWAGICGLFNDKDNTLEEDLLELGTPTRENLPDVVARLNEYDCKQPTYCIIDNYQMFDIAVQKNFITALSTVQNPKLHIVIITQPLKDRDASETTYQGGLYHKIIAQDFFFDNTCIAKYCRLTGIKISYEDIEQIQAVSDGWIAAIRLQLRNYSETGAFMDAGAIGSLVETAVWNKLSAAERSFLLGVALLDGFTAQQAAIINNGNDPDAVPEVIANLLSMDFFVRYVADKKVYSMHSILRDYLLERFAIQPRDFIDAMYRKAAAASVAAADYFQAARFFMQVKDYNAILSLPFTTQYFYNSKENNLISLFERLVDECPREVMQRHIMTSLLIGYLFFRNGAYPYFFKLNEIISDLLDHPRNLTETELAQARAEFAILLSFPEFNNITKMSFFQRKAYDCLKPFSPTPRSSLFYGNMPWSLGVPSVMVLYWSKSGELLELLDAMDDCLPIYSELASGHGAGAEIVFRAEASLFCGDDNTAEALCHKALYRARDAQQLGVCLCAELVLAEIAILRGDTAAYAAIRDDITNTADEARQRTVFRMGELCLAVLDLNLGITQNLPDWLNSMEGIRKILYAPAMPYGFMLYGHRLLHKSRHAELYGLTEHALALAQKFNYVLPQVHQHIYLAVAQMRENHADKALAHLRDALRLALPDKIYLPFAKFYNELRPLLETLATEPEFSGMAKLFSFCKRYARGLRTVCDATLKCKSVLTPREKEIANLAKERLSASEIAEKLFISVNTVNTILKSVYRKLGINSKAALKNKEF